MKISEICKTVISPLCRTGALLVALSCVVSASAQVYKDKTASVEARVNDLMQRMTPEEKIEQMGMHGLGDYPGLKVAYGVCDSSFDGLEKIADQSRKAKRHARENTRLGIPPIQIAECLHGLLAYGATIFPQAIAQGSTWNPELVKAMSSAVADEASAVGVDQALSPLFDLIRDARYGRNEECYAEDPYLVAEMGKAFVTGMQGDPEQTKDAIPEGKLMCTAKHFAGYSVPWAGINLAPSSLGEREMRTLYLYPFEKVVKEANVYAVMPSYNEVDGVPAHANRWLLRDVLKGEWGFDGYVFSDYGGLSHLENFHHTSADKADAAYQGVTAGVDVEAARPDIYPNLLQLVNDGKVEESLIDDAVRRILTAKFKSGFLIKSMPILKISKSGFTLRNMWHWRGR